MLIKADMYAAGGGSIDISGIVGKPIFNGMFSTTEYIVANVIGINTISITASVVGKLSAYIGDEVTVLFSGQENFNNREFDVSAYERLSIASAYGSGNICTITVVD